MVKPNTVAVKPIAHMFICFPHFCPGTITTHAESINSDRGLDRRLRYTTMNTEQNQLAIKVSADN